MKKIRKAVIPAAGYGTGFLPATKAFAKEMLPIVDKPIVQFIVEEAIASGIEEILIITGKTKRPIEDHFDSNIELEDNLRSKGKADLLKLVEGTTQANLFFVRQSYPKGLGDAILAAKAFVADEPFVVMLGDNIMTGEKPVTRQLMDLYQETQTANVAIMEVSDEEAEQMGIVELGKEVSSQVGLPVHHIDNMVEKPKASELKSHMAIAGRYVLPPEIFDLLEDLPVGKEDEVQLTDALNKLNQTQRVLAVQCQGNRHDVGNKMGYMRYMVEYGLNHPETELGLKAYIKRLAIELDK